MVTVSVMRCFLFPKWLDGRGLARIVSFPRFPPHSIQALRTRFLAHRLRAYSRNHAFSRLIITIKIKCWLQTIKNLRYNLYREIYVGDAHESYLSSPWYHENRKGPRFVGVVRANVHFFPFFSFISFVDW